MPVELQKCSWGDEGKWLLQCMAGLHLHLLQHLLPLSVSSLPNVQYVRVCEGCSLLLGEVGAECDAWE